MVRLGRGASVCFALLVVVGLVQAAPAADSTIDELTKVMPDNVVHFVATGGGALLKADFQETVLGRLWNDPGMQTFVSSIRVELMTLLDKEAEKDEGAKDVAKALKYGRLILDRPVLVGVAGVEAEQGPPACFFAIVDARDRKPELAALLTRLTESIGDGEEIIDIEVGSLAMRSFKDTDDVPIYWGWADDYLVVAVNDAKGAVVKHLASPRSAAADHLQKTPNHGDLIAAYYDVRRIWDIVDAIAASEGDEEKLTPVKAVFKQLGLNNVETVAARVGFSGPDLVSDVFVGAPAPRTGLLAAFKPVDLALLGTADTQAVTAGAFNCDLMKVYDTVMNVIRMVSPDKGYPQVQEFLAEFEVEAGVRIREGLLESLAGPVMFYSLPAGKMVEAPAGGVVAMAKLSDSALFEKTMARLEAFATKATEGGLQAGVQQDNQGRTMHVWASPVGAFAQIMPTWSVVEDQVVIGSNTALYKMGVKRVASKGQGTTSLLETDGFKKATEGLPAGLLSLNYVDAPVMFNQMLMQAQQLWPMAVMGAMQAGVKLPVMLPSVGHIAQDMQPSCEYSYVDAEGFHSHYQGSGLQMSMRDVAVGALGAGILMPALARVRQLAFRMTSGTNLVGLGKACMVYADDHDDRLPPNLEVLIDEVNISPKSLISKRRPEDFDGPSYVYISGQTLAMHPGNIVAYEDTRYCLEGVNVLFLDTHVEFMKPEAFRKELKATYERLGREMPEIQFRD